MSDFPEFLRARSQIRVTTYLPPDVELEFVGGVGEVLAEDGRKKSNMLPPLDKEASFARQPRQGGASLNSSKDSDEKSLRKVSVKMDRKIISHLKVHLNKRLQKRFDQQEDRLEYLLDHEDKDKLLSNGIGSKVTGLGDGSIFTNYSETGEKIENRKLRKAKSPSRQVQGIQRPTATVGVDELSNFNDSNLNEDVSNFRKASPLPGIPSSSQRDSGQANGNGVHVNDDGADENVEINEDDIHILTIDDEDVEVKEVDFRLTDVSPVQTPAASRPQSSVNDWVTCEDQARELLSGAVHLPCPADRAVLNLYIAAGYSDTEAERFFMQEHLYPALRTHCMHQGHELRVHDLHWGFKDAVVDDHRMLDVMQKVIREIQESMHGLNFVILLGQKSGASVLPSTIPQEELEKIGEVALRRSVKQRAELKTRIAEVEAARSEREAKAKVEGSLASLQVDAAPSSGRFSDDAPDSARTTTTKDGSEDAQPSAAEHRRAQNLASKKEQQELRALREAQENIPDVDLLFEWYKLDKNAVPAVYKLQPISSVYKEILRYDAMKRTAAKTSYEVIAAKIQRLFLEFAPQVLNNEEDLRKYLSSVLEQEVRWILDDPETTNDHHTVALIRSLDRCELGLQDASASQYLDIVSGKTPTLDQRGWKRIEALRKHTMETVPEKLCANFLLDWSADGIKPAGNREHFVYAERMCKTVHDLVVKQLAEAPRGSETWFAGGAVWRRKLFEEVSEHIRCSKGKSKDFQGRKDILTLMKAYLKSDYRRPLVVHGKTGCGKSALIGKTAKEIHKWFQSEPVTPRVIVRMIGCTTESMNIRTLIRGICLQLCHIFGSNPAHVPTDSKGVSNDFVCRLSKAEDNKPLILLLDATDRLSDEHEGRKLIWLPAELPPNVHIIISTVSDESLDCLPCARKLLNGHDKSFLEIPKLPEECAMKMVTRWLGKAQRRLTEDQTKVLVNAFSKCPYPLFLKIIVCEALTWTSYANPESIKLGETVKQASTLKFGRLERDHGEALIRRALGYISASRNGVSVTELEDLLSLDEAVMDEIVATHKPPRRRIPCLLWTRLKMDLDGLITEVRADGTKTITWAHQQIRDAADDRYLQQRDKAPSYHKALADYFLGKWAGKPKPYTGSERGTDRLVASQDLYYDPPPSTALNKPVHLKTASNQNSQEDQKIISPNRNIQSRHQNLSRGQTNLKSKQNGSTSRGQQPGNNIQTEEIPERKYNLRRVNELPFHLTRSQQTSLLKQNCLCNYEWILAKLCGTSLRSLLEEYSAILTAEPHEPELRLISDALHLSGPALRKEPKQLASQLVGRLHRIVTSDVPRAKGDPQRYPNLHPLLAAAKQSSLPALIPSVECLTEPGGILFDLLSGHSAPITAVGLTSDGQRALTTSRDGSLRLWDVRSGKVVKSIEGVGVDVSTVKAAKLNTIAVTIEMCCIKLWHLKTGVCIHTVDQYPDPASVCIAGEGQLLVAVFDGSNMLRTWSMDNLQIVCEASIPNNSAHKDATLLIADSSFGDLVLHAFKNGNSAAVHNARSGKILKALTCHEPSSSVTALAVSREYFVVCVRQQYMSLHELICLELFDGKKGTYVRTVRGCIHDRVMPQAFTTNLIGTHAVAVSANPRNNTSDVALWNLETEDHKHLAHHPSFSTMGACLDFRYCMTGAQTENSLRVWDISGKVNQPGMKLKKQLGVAEIWPMIDNPRYVVAKAVNNGPISVWNVAKGKCLQSAVRIERGLTEGSDAIVMRNTTLVILTDRGFSTVSEDSRPVFQTVLVYDLKLKKYTRRLPGCYIVPAPSHEYVLLDNDSLLGPSDNRSHFIIWNLVNGHAAARIKTNFKELERRRMEQGVSSGLVPGASTGGIQLTDIPSKGKRVTSAMMTPWDRRAETESARRHRHERESEQERLRQEELRREKDNVVEMFLVSADQTTIVASFYAHHLCVFDIASQVHTQTLQTESSMLFLHTAALTKDGGHLVLANYDESSKTSYVTLWDCITGEVKRRLKNEANVAALAITDDASRVLIGHAPDELHIWDPMRPNSLRRIRGRGGIGSSVLNFGGNSIESGGGFHSPCQMFIVAEGARAIVFAGDVSVWDLDRGTMLAAFSPDTRITACNVVLDGALTVFGMYDKPELVILRLSGAGAKFQVLDSVGLEDGGVELFGETTGDTSDEDEVEEEDEEGDGE